MSCVLFLVQNGADISRARGSAKPDGSNHADEDEGFSQCLNQEYLHFALLVDVLQGHLNSDFGTGSHFSLFSNYKYKQLLSEK